MAAMIGIRGWLLYAGFTTETPEHIGVDYAALQRDRMAGIPESVRLVAPLRGVSAPSRFVQADHSKPPLASRGGRTSTIGLGEWAAMPEGVESFKALHGYQIRCMAIVRPEWTWAADALRARYR